MKKFIIQSTILLTLIFLGLALWTGRITEVSFLPQPVKLAQVEVDGAVLNVEIADTPATRSKGLGGRESLDSNSGMLFVFNAVGQYSFWMKGLKFPLDFIWIKDGAVVEITKNVPPPTLGQTDASLPTYQPRVAVDSMLEVNAGTVDRLSIQTGDKVKVK